VQPDRAGCDVTNTQVSLIKFYGLECWGWAVGAATAGTFLRVLAHLLKLNSDTTSSACHTPPEML